MSAKSSRYSLPPSEITPRRLYYSRREFLKAMGIVSAASLLAACAPAALNLADQNPSPVSGLTDELGTPANTFQQITTYNNYYEFSTDKQAVNPLSADFLSTPWSVEVGGLVNKPKTYSLEELLSFEQEQRIYRMRCVEAWSMVIPWTGFELNKLLAQVEPLPDARYVAFTALLDLGRFPGQKNPLYPWPYTEGLRLDEAMHPLTILATGLYGESLPNSTGAPLRLVVPWKYGFKSIKAIVRIDLTDQQPATLWNTIAPHEYGFYANVNPQVDHPRWSQRTERRIGEIGRRDTLMFNGYADSVASLYEGMDLSIEY